MVPKIIGGIVLIALIAGGFFYYQSMQNKEPVEETVLTISEAPEPSPTPEVEVDKAEFEIAILNGSGIVGEAGRAQELLEDAEFIVLSTGNAETYNYDETVIQAGSEVSDAWLIALTEELSSKYSIQATVEELEDDEADVVVIIGNLDADGKEMGSADTADDDSDTEDSTDEASTTTPTPTD